MSEDLDPAHNLPEGVRVDDADCHLYRVGLSLHKPRPNCQRSLFYNPLLVFLCLCQHVVRNVLLFIYRTEKYVVSPETRLYWGYLEYFIGTGVKSSFIK